MPKLKFIYCLPFVFLLSCKSEPIQRCFYLWKANQTISNQDNNFFTKNNIKHLYIRFFDVGLNEKKEPTPKSILQISGKINRKIQITPTIFIENSVFLHLTKQKTRILTLNIIKKINEIINTDFKDSKFKEIQFDCDWTPSTKDNYFYFLKTIKAQNFEKKISVTIRLHQVKYSKKTGVPPADKGVLMYYNMGKLKQLNEPNSILNNTIGKLYIADIKQYPLILSVALPVYSWGVWFKNLKFNSLIYKINAQNIEKLSFLSPSKNNYYTVNKDTVYNEKYLRYGDIIRLEKPNLQNLETAKDICKQISKQKITEIILYNYDKENSDLITPTILNKIYSTN